jgi:hypothetical protein
MEKVKDVKDGLVRLLIAEGALEGLKARSPVRQRDDHLAVEQR